MRRIDRQSGFALILTLLATLLVATMAFAAIGMVLSTLQGAQQERNETQTYFMARSGLHIAADQLCNVGITWTGATYSWNGGTITITVTANPNNNASNQTNQWLASVVATYNGSQRKLQGLLQTDSFAKYAFFSDKLTDASGAPVMYFTQGVNIKDRCSPMGRWSSYQHPAFFGNRVQRQPGRSGAGWNHLRQQPAARLPGAKAERQR